jgi:amino acid transporter
MDDPFNLLIFTGFAYWIFSALVPLALVILRYKDPERPRPFRVLLYPLTPLLFFIASLIMTGAVIKNDILNVEKWIDSGSLLKNPPTTFVSLLVFAVGAIVFMAQRIKKLKNK